MYAGLRRGKDEALGLNRPGTEKRVPVAAAARRDESRGDRDYFGASLGKSSIQRGKPHIVAD